MLKKLRKSSVGLSLAAAIAVAPMSVEAASGSGFVEASSESSSAAIETPSFEKQLNRINVGINLIRINTDILENMPVSEDSEWVDKVVEPMSTDKFRQVMAMDDVKNDAFYATSMLTNVILRRVDTPMTPLVARLYLEAAAIYKNKTNASDTNNYASYKLPNMNVFPDITNSKTYVSFKRENKVDFIDVEATKGNLYKNVEEAVISLLPEDLQESVKSAKDEFIVAQEDAGEAKSNVKALEAWLDDDANINSPEKEAKKEELAVANEELNAKDSVFDEKEESYFMLLAQGSDAIEANFDATKIPLAKKLQKLLDAVDNNSMGAIGMFASATAGIYRGHGTIQQEMRAIMTAQALTTLVGNQKQFLIERYSRMVTGTLLAVPNVFIGSYYAVSQSAKIGKYQDIVDTVLAAEQATPSVEVAAK